ncbi:hypothetical protein [Vibrio parahaemolyticus]|uniref:hypothetical protein n=1 Tax=Vibrio parahaemolyticus TaxID=670 RepID=UPI003D7D7A53
MRTVAKRKMDVISIELERLKELCRQQADFKSELQQALQEFAENYCDESGRKSTDYFELINESASKLEDAVCDVMTQIEDYSDNRSGKWQEGEMGSKYRTWYEQWSDFNNAVGRSSLSDDAVTVSLEMTVSYGVDDFLEPPSMHVSEVEPSYSCW